MAKSKKRFTIRQPGFTNPAVLTQQNRLAAVLDGLNAFGVLETVQKRPPPGLLCFGPQAVRGESWVGVVIWYRPPGYYHYQTIDLLGIWVEGGPDAMTISVGTRSLQFLAPFYNAESYFQHIRTTFETYYGSDVPPPEEAHRLLTALYDPARRIVLRREVEDAVARWRLTNHANRGRQP